MPAQNTPPGEQSPPARIAEALRAGSFDPQHAGDLFLRNDAEKAIRATLGESARIAVAGREGANLRPVGFMGARFAPDLVVEAGGERVAVTITLLRNDTAPIGHTLAGALVLSSRYDAVVAFILDRRLAKADPFADPDEAREVRGLSDAERQLIDQLWQRHHVRVEVRRQDPFGWG
jgi:hypothetical protein